MEILDCDGSGSRAGVRWVLWTSRVEQKSLCLQLLPHVSTVILSSQHCNWLDADIWFAWRSPPHSSRHRSTSLYHAWSLSMTLQTRFPVSHRRHTHIFSSVQICYHWFSNQLVEASPQTQKRQMKGGPAFMSWSRVSFFKSLHWYSSPRSAPNSHFASIRCQFRMARSE